MIDAFRELIARQYEAVLCTLDACIDKCSPVMWERPVGSLAFCQVAFHTLFFTDFYLGANEAALREQPFHREHPDIFRDYEELQPRRQVLLYSRADIKDYLEHCRSKAATVVPSETAEILTARCGFPPKTYSRAELHVTNIRHIQHHAAQLGLRLRLDAGEEIPWVGSGWHDV